MALATIQSRAQNGLAAEAVRVEVHLSGGLPGLSIVGLPEAAVREAKDRVRAAILNCGFRYPARRITINLAPADLPKEGGRFDLAIALGILAAAGEIPATALAGVEVLGELSLSGEVRGVRGALPAALQAKRCGHALLLPTDNLAEAALAAGTTLHPAHHLGAVCAALLGEGLAKADVPAPERHRPGHPDLRDVRGQPQARRALEVAAAGGHSLLMCGPPGSGKSMLAHRLPGLLPPLELDQATEVAAVASIARGGFDARLWGQRPFRAPHHTASAVALVGGGSNPSPGEITLAHHGVLFLDELPEFDRRVLEVLREPLEARRITVSRAARQAEFPAAFQLVAAMNPCPCGHLGDPGAECRCSATQVQRYRGRISGPLLDRIDLQLSVGRVAGNWLDPAEDGGEEDSESVRQRVVAARQRARERGVTANALLDAAGLARHAPLGADCRQLLGRAMSSLRLSARGAIRVQRVARTIADLDGAAAIETRHLAEAIGYRLQ